MTDEWFSEYVFEIVVDRKHVPQQVLDVLEREPVVLPAWDPMGALARSTGGHAMGHCDDGRHSMAKL